MNLTIEQIVSIISAVGISTIISAIIAFVQNNKKNNLDFVTKERSEWRKKLKEILSELSDDTKKESAIIKLKSEINPYGKDMELKNTKPYYMKEGHIWDLLDGGKEVDFERLAFYIELLLKFDWERSKSEVKFNPSTLLSRMIWLTLFILSICSSSIMFEKTNDLKNSLYLILFIVSIVSSVCILSQPLFTKYAKLNPSRHKREQLRIFFIFYAFPYVNISLTLLLNIPFLKSNILKIFAFVGLYVYEFYYLSLIESIEDDYVREVERVKIKRNYRTKKAITIYNSIDKLERKLYEYPYNKTDVAVLRKKRRKLQKKLIKKLRPSVFIFHPILYIRYRNKKSRISKIVKGLLTNI